jgi:glycosyltransferase involved in cell wall biosynthesis
MKTHTLPNPPFISVCTPTFNRRPFFPYLIKSFSNQTYPSKYIEWIIIDDGTDPVEDLVKDIPNVKYFYYETKMTLGKKRNIMHSKCKGDIIIYMDDDDYYPPTRISHAVTELLNNPTKLIAGCSKLNIYFNKLNEIYEFGPYGENHATAATFAFKKELLEQAHYMDDKSIAEEKGFLKNYTIPLIQLDTTQTILVFSHLHNTFDKNELLQQNPGSNPYVRLTQFTVSDFIKDSDLYKFYVEDLDSILSQYELGQKKHKPDVIIQSSEMTINRLRRNMESLITENTQLLEENVKLRTMNQYLNTKLRDYVQQEIKKRLEHNII